ncbi:MAG TPA: tRNA (adenosine(37)-N6)-dimethylallyltransferase MiaA [Terriglobales bacterium]|nr:tRNA (adenosine(37)-N6)-dimethylallyltransferase MiaA [Terriglobales bacterium]
MVIAGPTASGKTPLALALAEGLAVEVVNFDSVQIYRDFDVGSAKPSPDAMQRVQHHLIGVADAHEPWSAGEFARRARPVIEQIAHRRHLPILVGGTGFYLRALLDGLSPLPATPVELRERLQRRTPEQIHRLLSRLDPESARRIAARDASKAVRALEVRLLTGRGLGAAWQASPPEPWRQVRALRLGLAPERAALYQRIHERAAQMFSGPIQDEARRLLPQYPPGLRIWTSHGYKQAADIVLRGAERGAAQAEAELEQRHYAKRQWTWFRRDPRVQWLGGFGDDAVLQQQALELVRAWLCAPCTDPA